MSMQQLINSKGGVNREEAAQDLPNQMDHNLLYRIVFIREMHVMSFFFPTIRDGASGGR